VCEFPHSNAAKEGFMSTSSFLSRWTGRPESGEEGSPGLERPLPELLPPAPAPKRRSPASVWASSPSLERIYQELDEQVRMVEDAKRLLEERLAPFQRHLLEQRRNIDQALKQLDARIKPLRQYLEGQGHNLERMGVQLTSEVRDQFESFEKFLTEQRQILERANRYLDEQPRPLGQYLEDEQRAVEHIFRDLEERLEPFGRLVKEQQKILDAIAEPRVTEEYQTVAQFCSERQAAVERYASASEYRPQALFGELDAIYQKYRGVDAGKSKLLGRILEQARQADLRLQDALKPLPPRELSRSLVAPESVS
jgi:hypothetical protein